MNIIQNIYYFLKKYIKEIKGGVKGTHFFVCNKTCKKRKFSHSEKNYISVNNVDRAFYLFFMFKLDKNNRTVIEGQNSVSQAVLMKKINQNPFFAQICDFDIF